MKRIFVKICGLTDYDDAAFATEAGAEYLGFVLADSVRRIGLDDAATLIGRLRTCFGGEAPRMVAVVVNPSPEEMQTVSGIQCFDLVQVHHPAPELAAYRSVPWYPVLPLAVGGAKGLERAAEQEYRFAFLGTTDIVLGDAAVAGMAGGSGVRVATDAACAARDFVHRAGKLFFLAGGLRPETVLDVLGHISPDGIDVSSGLEESPGRKSKEKIQVFLRHVREWEHQQDQASKPLTGRRER